jgi:PBP1b-binding outer membrane lipoprotein LpoB
MKVVITLIAAAMLMVGCTPDTEVSQADVEKNQKEFSQENYEKAMIAAGKGKELEEEKKRNAAYSQGGQ